MTRPINTFGLRVRQAPNLEWGIWRTNEDEIPYLLLTFPIIEEAIEIGNKLEKMFSIPCAINKSVYYREKKNGKIVHI